MRSTFFAALCLLAVAPFAALANETSPTVLPGTCVPGQKGVTVKAFTTCCKKEVNALHLEAVTATQGNVLNTIRADKNDPKTLCLPVSENGIIRTRVYLEPEQNRSYTGQTLVVGALPGGQTYAYVKFRKGDQRGQPSKGDLLQVKTPITSFQFNGQQLIKPTSAAQVGYGKQGDTVQITFCANECVA